MSVLGDVREVIADALLVETTAQVLTYVPSRIVPPIYIITADSPYVSASDTFGQFKANFSIEIVSPVSANDTNTEALDLLIEDAVVALSNERISFSTVSQPYGLEANNATYLAASISVSYNTAI